MRLHRATAALFAGTLVTSLAATTALSSPAQAAKSGWDTVSTFQGARAQICTVVNADGTATVRVRINNKRGSLKVSAGIASVRANGRPDRTLVTTKFVGAGQISGAAEWTKLGAAESFYVDIAQKWEEGAGVVKTTPTPFVVAEQKPC
jgi:hypothetical protein